MNVIKYPNRSDWSSLTARPAFEQMDLEKAVRKILIKVKKGGDKAIKKLTRELDGVSLRKLIVDKNEITHASKLIPQQLKEAIEIAKNNISLFHASQVIAETVIETMPGVRCWRKSIAIEKVGLYIPGGTAPLFSTVLMLGIPASIAGCREVVLCTPPGKDGKINPAILYAARQAGISTIIKAGGAQAIAAMAYGTESIPKVDKIFGPGNQYVTCAKQLVQVDGMAIDMPAGPSEVCAIADETANPKFIAADLLSQAEHGPDSQVLLVSVSVQIIDEVLKEMKSQVELLPRKEIAIRALQNSKAILLSRLDEAIDLVNAYAAEHLIISCADAPRIADKIINAGSVFLGNYSPESVGDYASGTNHTLPTNGFARSYSGVSVDSFVKKITFQELTSQGLYSIASTVETMAMAEGLEAHANAVRIRRQ